MALLHKATIRPGKLELLSTWLPTRSWFPTADASDLVRVGAYRFDDPDGEVGMETFLLRAGDGPLVQVPLTYRGAPLDGADRWLVGTTEHSTLGRRWVYDGCGDPVYAAALTRAIVTGGGQAEEFYERDGRREYRDSDTQVRGSGTGEADVPAVTEVRAVEDGDPTRVRTDAGTLTVVRVLTNAEGGAGVDEAAPLILTGTWTGQATPVVLATAETD